MEVFLRGWVLFFAEVVHRFLAVLEMGLQITDCGLQIADCGLQISDCRFTAWLPSTVNDFSRYSKWVFGCHPSVSPLKGRRVLNVLLS